jgi:hypothetical protein
LGEYLFAELFVNNLCLRLKIRVGRELSSLYFVGKIMGRGRTRVGCLGGFLDIVVFGGLSALLLLEKANGQSLKKRKGLKRWRNLIKRAGVGEALYENFIKK